MLSKSMSNALNEQVNIEFYSSNLYLQMSSWCLQHGLDGSAAFLRRHSIEEMNHMQRLFDYINEAGSQALLGAIKEPDTDFESISQVFKTTYEHECFITQKINGIVDIAFREKDYSTFNFLQWYVAEQHEEEALFKSILDKLNLIGTDGTGLYHFDHEMKSFDPNEDQ